MHLIHRKTGAKHQAVIELVEDSDWKIIAANSHFEFKWLKERERLVHKIRLELEEEILGLISLEDIPRELRIHIRLIELNSLDRGRKKRFQNIAGCLFAFTCRLAFKKGYKGYVSMYPKTDLRNYYIENYGFKAFGKNLFVELVNSERLIQKYLENE